MLKKTYENEDTIRYLIKLNSYDKNIERFPLFYTHVKRNKRKLVVSFKNSVDLTLLDDIEDGQIIDIRAEYTNDVGVKFYVNGKCS